MFVRVWTKADTQIFIAQLRKEGYTVDKVDNGYVCHHKISADKIDLVFRAMVGPHKRYLCRINPDYVKQDESDCGDVKREMKSLN